MPYAIFDTAIGACALAWSDDGVTWVQLPEASLADTRARLLAKAPDALPEWPANDPLPAWTTDAITRIQAHLAGRPHDLASIPLDLSRVTPFTAKLYRALQAIPAGRTISYGELATAAGSPRAARAVGRAMATNPFPLLVPCHRVLAAGGAAGGFSAYGGVVTKDRLLTLEGFVREAQTSLFAGSGTSLPFDPAKAVAKLTEADPVLGRHMAHVGPFALKLKSSEDTFAALAESIVYQQLTGKAAATIFGRVRALYPGGRLDPKRLLATSEESLRAAGLSAGKLASLRDLAKKAKDGEVPTLAELGRMDDEAIVERLTAIRGIGRWTVEMLLIFRLGRPDVLPLGDYGVKKGFARVFPRRNRRAEADGDDLPTAAEMTRRGDRWRPFRSVASWYLWRALD